MQHSRTASGHPMAMLTFPELVPTHELRGPDDAGDRGNWIPTTALDQYAATLGNWFNVPEANLQTIFPNLGNFSPQQLAFV